MAIQSEPYPNHAPIPLRGLVENLSKLHSLIIIPEAGPVGCKLGKKGKKKMLQKASSKLAMAGKAALPHSGISTRCHHTTEL